MGIEKRKLINKYCKYFVVFFNVFLSVFKVIKCKVVYVNLLIVLRIKM